MREVSREAHSAQGLGWRAVALVLLWMMPIAAVWSQSLPPLESVKSLDVPRYLGRWYEIAKFPNRFQRECVSDTSADYTLLPDGHLRVLNLSLIHI